MTNPYYNFTEPLTAFFRARSGDVNAQFAAIAAGFDAIPAPGESSFGTPTVKVALTFDGGSEDTVMRSDARLAIDEDIAPTWTSRHTFAGIVGTAETRFASNTPGFSFYEADGAANNRLWRQYVASEQLTFDVQNDVESSATTWLAVNRTANTIDSIALTSTALTWNGNTLFSAANDGAGSGLDADLIDGVQGSDLARLSQSNTFAGNQIISNAAPTLLWEESDQAVDEKRWAFRANSKAFSLWTYDDGLGAIRQHLVFGRGTGGAVTGITFGNATDNPTFTFAGTGSVTVGGVQVATRGANTFTDIQTLSATAPALRFNETDAAANNRLWDFAVSAEQFLGRMVNDAISTATAWLAVERTANTCDSITLTGTAIELAGNVTINTVQVLESSTFTGTLTGFGSNPSGTVGYRKVGSNVTLYINSNILGTSNAATLVMTGLPAAVTPGVERAVVCAAVQDSGQTYLARATISAINTITFSLYDTSITANRVAPNGAGFTSSGSKGLVAGWTISYTL